MTGKQEEVLLALLDGKNNYTRSNRTCSGLIADGLIKVTQYGPDKIQYRTLRLTVAGKVAARNLVHYLRAIPKRKAGKIKIKKAKPVDPSYFERVIANVSVDCWREVILYLEDTASEYGWKFAGNGNGTGDVIACGRGCTGSEAYRLQCEIRAIVWASKNLH